MDRLHQAATRTVVMAFLFLVLISILWVETGESQDEAINISCFFCHMEIIAEMKAHAVKHWEADTKCEACHGASMEHLDVEDNSVKPDKVWNNATVHGLCKECHQHAFASYASSSHARLAMEAKPGAAKAPNCSSCHGYHGLTSEIEIKDKCVSCHPTLPAACASRPGATDVQALPCKECHNSHSLSRK